MMKLVIATSPLFSDKMLQPLDIEVATLLEAFASLDAYVQEHFPGCCQKMNSFRWDVWDDDDKHVALWCDGVPMELINFEDKPMNASLTALEQQIAVYKQTVPLGGQAFYAALNALVAECKVLIGLVNLPSSDPMTAENFSRDGRVGREALVKSAADIMNGLPAFLADVQESKIKDSFGSGSDSANAQWQAIKQQVKSICYAASDRLEDLTGIHLDHCRAVNDSLGRPARWAVEMTGGPFRFSK